MTPRSAVGVRGGQQRLVLEHRVLIPPAKRGLTISERFWSKVDTSGECWLWMAVRTVSGYGQFTPVHGKRAAAHRWAYAETYGAIPAGLTLDHLCRTRACVKPAHLEPVSVRINVLRGAGRTAILAQQTHCKHGHPFDAVNTYHVPDANMRQCRTCKRLRQREYDRKARVCGKS